MAANELERALGRPDADTLTRQVDAYANYFAKGGGDWPDEHEDDFDEILMSGGDPEKALAYVIIAASRTDNAEFLRFLGCGPLENLLFNAPRELIERIAAEARRSTRFRWLLSHPFKIAINEAAWEAIEPFRLTGPHEEASLDTLPPRDTN